MKIRTISGALVLMMSAVSSGSSQAARPAVVAPAPSPAPAIAASPVASPAPVVETAPVAVVAPLEPQEPVQAPPPEDAPDPVVAPDSPPRAGSAAPPGAARGPRAGRPDPPGRPGQAQPPDGPPPANAMAPPDDRHVFVEDSLMKNQIFDVRHRDPVRLQEVLRALGSGRRGAVIDASREFNTITVRDYPEILLTIDAAIKRLDVPAPASSDIDIRLFVLLASSLPDGADSELPLEIRGAVQQLRAAFGYKAFRLLTPIMQRSREGHAPTRSSGVVSGATLGSLAELNSDLRYGYELRSITRASELGGVSQINLTGFEFQLDGHLGRARIASDLSLKPGEQVIVGSASLKRTALILILSATVVK